MPLPYIGTSPLDPGRLLDFDDVFILQPFPRDEGAPISDLSDPLTVDRDLGDLQLRTSSDGQRDALPSDG